MNVRRKTRFRMAFSVEHLNISKGQRQKRIHTNHEPNKENDNTKELAHIVGS